MKYCCNKVKVGDWVYFYDVEKEYETKCKYKVVAVKKTHGIIVEVKNNGMDKSYIKGWLADGRSEQKLYNLPKNIKAWHVNHWYKASRSIEIE